MCASCSRSASRCVDSEACGETSAQGRARGGRAATGVPRGIAWSAALRPRRPLSRHGRPPPPPLPPFSLQVLGDAVLNHRCAQVQDENGVWNKYGGKMAWDQRAIVGACNQLTWVVGPRLAGAGAVGSRQHAALRGQAHSAAQATK